MRVYKYRSKYDIDIKLLSRSKIYAPNKHQLNDPFEGIVEKKIFDDYNFLKPHLSPSAYEYKVNNVKKLLIQVGYLGIYSLSKKCDNELLWAHYSNAHKGYCIEYELNELILEETKTVIFPEIIEVKYNEEPPIYTLERIENFTQDELQKYYLETLIGTKSMPWKYEDEIRVLFRENGEQKININAIKSIIFGALASDDDINNTISMLSNKINYSKIEIADKYKLIKKNL
jgi:hypothetical protein